jgi:hypothetical protein
MGGKTFARAAALAAVMLAAVPAAASAQLYASPSGVGSPPCSQGAPCSLATAVANGTSSDGVYIEPGNYSVSSTLTNSSPGTYIEGIPGEAKPSITFTGVSGTLMYLTGSGWLSDVSLDDPNGEALQAPGETTARVIIIGSPGAGNALCDCQGGLLASSLIINNTGTAVGYVGKAGDVNVNETLINDTLLPEAAGATAIDLRNGDGNNQNVSIGLTATNVIARNIAGGPEDVVATGNAGDPSGTETIEIDHSDYAEPSPSGPGATIQDGAGDFSGAPVFGAGLFNYSEAVSSPTIGIGLADAATLDLPGNAGSYDLAGNPRTVGPPGSYGNVDIGAYEFQFQPIHVTVSASVSTADVGQAITFTASATDPNAGAGPLTYSWGFDNANATGATVTHAFSNDGTEYATVTVSDGTPYLATATTSVNITVPIFPNMTEAALTLRQPTRRHGKHKATPFSAQFSFLLNTAATVTGDLRQKFRGKRHNGRCETARIAGHSKPCPTTKPFETFTLTDAAGANFGELPSSAIPKHLPPGRYVLTLVASTALGTSRPVTWFFSVR